MSLTYAPARQLHLSKALQMAGLPVTGMMGYMATAYIDWSNDDCDWGTTPIDDFEYSCANSSDGLHEWAFERAACIGCDEQESYCLECGYPGCGCGKMD